MTVLKLDHDTPRCPARFVWRTAWLCRRCGWTLRAVSLARSARGWHGEVLVRDRLTPLAIVAAQAILGSDWGREAHNLARVLMLDRAAPLWRTRWNVLYSGKTVRRDGLSVTCWPHTQADLDELREYGAYVHRVSAARRRLRRKSVKRR